MIEDTCLKDVDVIFALHAWVWLGKGTIGICLGAVMAQADSFDLKIIGSGGHVSAPHKSVGSEIISMLQNIIPQFTLQNKLCLEKILLTILKKYLGASFNLVVVILEKNVIYLYTIFLSILMKIVR